MPINEEIPIVVDNRVRMDLAFLGEHLATRICEEFEHTNPNREERAAYPKYKTWAVDEFRNLSVPRGGMARVREVIRSNGRRFKVYDRRTAGDWELLDHGWDGRIPAHKRELWKVQTRCVNAIETRQNCILEAHTGTGKSTAALALASRLQIPTLVIVNTDGLRKQWVKRIENELGVPASKIGIIGGGKRISAPITIAMQQTLARGIDPHWLQAFGMLICDEVDLFAAPTFFAAVDPWPAMFRVGVTATVKRHDKKEFMVYDLFGEVVANITEEEAIAEGHTVGVEFRVVPTDFDSPSFRAAIASKNKFWIRNSHRKMTETMWGDSARNEVALGIVEEHVAKGDQVMIISTRREHCFMLDRELVSRGVKSGVMLGGTEAKEQFERTLDLVLSRNLSVVVGTEKAIGRGQDFPAISIGVVTMPITKDATLVKQLKGRFCRACEEIGKTGGVLYFIWDPKLQGKSVLKNLLKCNKRVLVKVFDKWVDAKEIAGSRVRASGEKRGSFARPRLKARDKQATR